MKNKVCAVIITYNIDKKIVDVVDSIINQVEKVVIIDNASKDETIKILRDISTNDKVELILNSSNEGIAYALNKGVKFAENNDIQWVLTLDHDSICNENMVKDMLQVYDEIKDSNSIGILAPKVFEINKQKFISKKHEDNIKYIEVKDCIQSGSLFNIDLFKKIGYFNEELFIYHVDYDFCERTRKSGYKIIQCNDVILYHEEGYKVPKKFLGIKTFYNNYSANAIYYITRNTIYMSKNYSIFYSKRILKDFVYIMLYDKERFSKLKYLKKGLSDALLNKYGKLNLKSKQ